MTLRLRPPVNLTIPDELADEQSSQDDSDNEYPEEDNNFDDWVSDEAVNQPCRSLFEDKVFPSAPEALAHDKAVYNFDYGETCMRLKLDLHQRIRLINYIRKHKSTPVEVQHLSGKETFFSSDEYLIPVVEDDPLLQFESSEWSDDEDPTAPHPTQALIPGDLDAAIHRIHSLEKKLSDAKQELIDYQAILSQTLDVASLSEVMNDPGPSRSKPARDDDSHYFESYGANDIHAVMIQDRVRTSSYASFIFTNPSLFHDAVVLDVGCGTGILSLFAAKSGARRVFAVDASDIAEKAEKIVKANGLDDIITVIRGKIEDISLPDGIEHVDIIISEWMGYALLYESMLDSVLRARDRFLRPESGVMAPSQCRMMLALCEGSEILKDRVEFWHDVYGFDMSVMTDDLYEEAIIDVVGPESVVSEPCVVKDLYLPTTAPRNLDFVSKFQLTSTTDRRTKIHAFVLYFDTFFTSSGEKLPLDTEVKLTKEGDAVLAEVWPVGGRPAPARRVSQGEGLKGKAKQNTTSFSTGPNSHPTHWKQTIFLLKEPIVASEGTVVSGTFHCQKSEMNSRELDVEIHYSVNESAEEHAAGDVVVRIYKVR